MSVFQTTRLHEQLAAALAREIVSGELLPGAVVPSEPELVRQFGVSKTVARETIQALGAVGLIRVQQGKRTVVLEQDQWDILSGLVQQAYREAGNAAGLVRDLYAVRSLLEPPAARWAAEHADAADVAALRERVGLMREAIAAGNPARFLEHDRAFHLEIAELSRNRVLRAIVRDINELLQTSWLLSALSTEETEVACQTHAEIVAAIADRDGERAERTMGEHLEWAASVDRTAPT
jgi:DNA-binding FadR family transcriptional regulator